ncbi:MAG: hypothetical protein IIA54_01215 [Chloroflexi bacterium]|nr:hypothetical protein [Chloroflexota bacterium]
MTEAAANAGSALAVYRAASRPSVPVPAPGSSTQKTSGEPMARHIWASWRATSAPKTGCVSGAV